MAESLKWSTADAHCDVNGLDIVRQERTTAELSDDEIIVGTKCASDFQGNTVSIQFLIATLPADLAPLPK